MSNPNYCNHYECDQAQAIWKASKGEIPKPLLKDISLSHIEKFHPAQLAIWRGWIIEAHEGTIAILNRKNAALTKELEAIRAKDAKPTSSPQNAPIANDKVVWQLPSAAKQPQPQPSKLQPQQPQPQQPPVEVATVQVKEPKGKKGKSKKISAPQTPEVPRERIPVNPRNHVDGICDALFFGEDGFPTKCTLGTHFGMKVCPLHLKHTDLLSTPVKEESKVITADEEKNKSD